MEIIQNTKIKASFYQGILSIKFDDGADIRLIDVKQIYDFGNEKSKGQPYCILFDHSTEFLISQSAIEYASNKIENSHILAKAYVVNTEENKIKVKRHIVFDKPIIKPHMFESEIEATKWLKTFLEK